jgi:hypothetical protein
MVMKRLLGLRVNPSLICFECSYSFLISIETNLLTLT